MDSLVANSPAPAKPRAQEIDDHPGLPTPRRIWAIIAISFGTSLLVIDGSIPNVALPTIARELGVTNAAVTSVVTVYQLVLVMLLLPFSSVGDRIGHRRMYQYGQALFMAASAACLFAEHFAVLLLLRAAQAIGAGMALSVTSAMLRQIYPAKRLGTGLAINSVIVASSGALAPTLGGYIVGHLEWQYVFVAAAPLAIISMLMGRTLPEPERRPGKTNYVSSFWSAMTMLLVIGGLQMATHGMAYLGGVIGILGLVSASLLVRHERGETSPVLPVDLLAMPAVGFSVLASFASFIAAGTLMLSLPFRLEEGMGFDPQEVGLLLLPFPLTMLVVSPLSGWLSDRIAATKLGVTGLIIASIGMLLIAFMPEDAGPWQIGMRLSLTAVGYGLFFAPNTRLMISRAPRDRAAAAGGVQSTARLTGQALAAVTVGVLLAGNLGMGPMPLFVACALTLVAMGSSLARYRARGTA